MKTTNFLSRLEKFVSDEKTDLFIKLWYCSKKKLTRDKETDIRGNGF